MNPVKIKTTQNILDLKPTQFSVGHAEVSVKAAEMKHLKKKALLKNVAETKIPVVVSPWGELCIIDHHHFLFAAWQFGIKKVKVDVVCDLSNSRLNYVKFWKKMVKLNYAHLEDQFGEGPRNPLYLPIDIRGLADDPYRSLAWLVRQHGGFGKSDQPFAEFIWANFLRKKNLLNAHGKAGMKTAVKQAVKLCQSRAAKALPGFTGPVKGHRKM